MPLYEFKCGACEKVSEFLLKHGESKRKCPECGANRLKKIISQVRYQDTYSPMHPRRGRGVGGYGRIDPGEGLGGINDHLG